MHLLVDVAHADDEAFEVTPIAMDWVRISRKPELIAIFGREQHLLGHIVTLFQFHPILHDPRQVLMGGDQFLCRLSDEVGLVPAQHGRDGGGNPNDVQPSGLVHDVTGVFGQEAVAIFGR